MRPSTLTLTELYWGTSMTLAEIDEALCLGLDPQYLTYLWHHVDPLPTGMLCPYCGTELVHRSRTKRRSGRADCRLCFHVHDGPTCRCEQCRRSRQEHEEEMVWRRAAWHRARFRARCRRIVGDVRTRRWRRPRPYVVERPDHPLAHLADEDGLDDRDVWDVLVRLSSRLTRLADRIERAAAEGGSADSIWYGDGGIDQRLNAIFDDLGERHGQGIGELRDCAQRVLRSRLADLDDRSTTVPVGEVLAALVDERGQAVPRGSGGRRTPSSSGRGDGGGVGSSP